MTGTLTYKDTIQRIGHTTINGEKIVQYSCIISTDDPQNMRLSITKIDNDAYKANRAQCRADYAEFEDAAYALQDEIMAKM